MAMVSIHGRHVYTMRHRGHRVMGRAPRSAMHVHTRRGRLIPTLHVRRLLLVCRPLRIVRQLLAVRGSHPVPLHMPSQELSRRGCTDQTPSQVQSTRDNLTRGALVHFRGMVQLSRDRDWCTRDGTRAESTCFCAKGCLR